MLTGDKMETAENIGYSCNLVQEGFEKIYLRKGDNPEEAYPAMESALRNRSRGQKFTLIVDGQALIGLQANEKLMILYVDSIFTRCDSVICCRMSPKQKGDIVRMVKKYQD